MLIWPKFDPIAFSIGPLKVHWYGLMYLFGFAACWILGLYRSKKPWSPLKSEQVLDAVFYGAVGAIIGGRLGYMIFYDFANFIHHPQIVFYLWHGGMSFHGGLIGAIIAFYIYSLRIKINFILITDFFAPLAPIGLAAGRLGNFINGELWGRVTTSSIGMVFPDAGPLPRYPSQLIEFFLEGVVLFCILWIVSIKPRPMALLSALFLLFYSIFRFTAEFYRQPDIQLGFIFDGWLTQGQLLCIPMFILAIILLSYVYIKHKRGTPS